MQTLTPHVYWAQRHGEIYLRVELSDAQVCSQLMLYGLRESVKSNGELDFELVVSSIKSS